MAQAQSLFFFCVVFKYKFKKLGWLEVTFEIFVMDIVIHILFYSP